LNERTKIRHDNYMKILLTILILGIFFLPVNADEIKVQITGGIEKIDAFKEKSVVYFSLSELGDIFNESISWDIIGVSATMELEGHTATFFINSQFINIDDTVKNMTYPAKVLNGALYLPARTFIPLYDLMRPDQVIWDPNNASIRINSDWYNITDIAFSSKANGLLIELFMKSPMPYEVYESEGGWINLTVPGGRANIRQLKSRMSREFVRDMNVFQFEASAQISFRMKHGLSKYTSKFQNDPGRIQLSIIDENAQPLVQHREITQIGPDISIDKIIIDAGHGGDDYGAIGLKKTKEKKIVLDIAKRLAKLIRKEKIFEVVMTREKDKYVSLEKRAKIANDSKGDLFISIHANASPKRSARGFQVFFLAPANNDEARAAAQLENSTFAEELSKSDDSFENDLSFILIDMEQTEVQAESSDLAAMVDKEFKKKLGKKTKARGLDQAGFVVLDRVYMPSILVEAAFLTNKSDEKLLKSKKYRQEVAEAIYAGLKRFKNKYENK